jgi:RNA polymerase sigma-70 factor (ECF subfamily)
VVGASKSEIAALHATAEVEPATSAPSAQVVLSGVIAGERWAHEALYDLLFPVVARTLQKVLRDGSGDYEDLVQTSFERIVQTLVGERRVAVENLAAWAGSIAAHVALDALRSRIRERRLFEPEAKVSGVGERAAAPNLERQLEARQKLVWLQHALSRMSPEQAETVILHDVLGHSLAEIAETMEVSVAAAQRRLSRGHQELLRRAGKLRKEDG